MASLCEVAIKTTLAALQLVKQAALACDQNGLVLSANKEAERLIRQSSPCNRLTFQQTESAAQLSRLLAHATDREQSITVLTDGGAGITIRAVRLRGEECASSDNPILLLIKPVPLPLETTLRRSYRLTSAEVEVAVLLLEGSSVEEIAAKRQISPNTVRAQLKSIFTKTDTRSQVHFISQAARIIYAAN